MGTAARGTHGQDASAVVTSHRLRAATSASFGLPARGDLRSPRRVHLLLAVRRSSRRLRSSASARPPRSAASSSPARRVQQRLAAEHRARDLLIIDQPQAPRNHRGHIADELLEVAGCGVEGLLGRSHRIWRSASRITRARLAWPRSPGQLRWRSSSSSVASASLYSSCASRSPGRSCAGGGSGAATRALEHASVCSSSRRVSSSPGRLLVLARRQPQPLATVRSWAPPRRPCRASRWARPRRRSHLTGGAWHAPGSRPRDARLAQLAAIASPARRSAAAPARARRLCTASPALAGAREALGRGAIALSRRCWARNRSSRPAAPGAHALDHSSCPSRRASSALELGPSHRRVAVAGRRPAALLDQPFAAALRLRSPRPCRRSSSRSAESACAACRYRPRGHRRAPARIAACSVLGLRRELKRRRRGYAFVAARELRSIPPSLSWRTSPTAANHTPIPGGGGDAGEVAWQILRPLDHPCVWSRRPASASTSVGRRADRAACERRDRRRVVSVAGGGFMASPKIGEQRRAAIRSDAVQQRLRAQATSLTSAASRRPPSARRAAARSRLDARLLAERLLACRLRCADTRMTAQELVRGCQLRADARGLAARVLRTSARRP